MQDLHLAEGPLQQLEQLWILSTRLKVLMWARTYEQAVAWTNLWLTEGWRMALAWAPAYIDPRTSPFLVHL